MTIKEYLIGCELKAAEYRLSELKDMGAPVVMITGQEKCVEDMKAGIFKVSGDTELLEEEYVEREVKKGRSGKPYLTINGHINYFPKAKYGRYITEA